MAEANDSTTAAGGDVLEKLKAEIDAVGSEIRTLKGASPVDKDAVGVAVAKLMAAKKAYADANNGIGVDGKPFQEPGKKKNKQQSGPAKPVRVCVCACVKLFLCVICGVCRRTKYTDFTLFA